MNVREQLAALWDEIGPKSLEKFWQRVRREGIPATRKQSDEFVKDIPNRPNEVFRYPTQSGKSFSRGLDKEWKVDLIQYAKPSGDGDYYILLRLDSFSREADGVPLPSKSPQYTASGLTELLRRAAPRKPERVFTDLGTEWGGEFSKLLDREDIDHGDKDPEDHGSFSRIDSAIRTIKIELAIQKKKGLDFAEALPRVLREYNADTNIQTGAAPKDVLTNPEAKFRILKQESQAILHNIKDNDKREKRLIENDGLRPLLRDKDDDPDRTKGPKERADNVRWGNPERLAEGPNRFQFGQVVSTTGAVRPTKLTLESKMLPPEPLKDTEREALRDRLEKPMTHLWEYMIDHTGSLSMADALSYLEDEGALKLYQGRAVDIFKLFPELFDVDRGMVLAQIKRDFEGVPVRLEMPPAKSLPYTVREKSEKWVAPLRWGNGVGSELHKLDEDVHVALR